MNNASELYNVPKISSITLKNIHSNPEDFWKWHDKQWFSLVLISSIPLLETPPLIVLDSKGTLLQKEPVLGLKIKRVSARCRQVVSHPCGRPPVHSKSSLLGQIWMLPAVSAPAAHLLLRKLSWVSATLSITPTLRVPSICISIIHIPCTNPLWFRGHRR